MDYEVIARIDPCLWRQLGLRNQLNSMKLIVNDPSSTNQTSFANYPKVCNCELGKFFNKYGIKLSGACNGFNVNSCGTSQTTIDCSTRKEFECVDGIVTTPLTTELITTTLPEPTFKTSFNSNSTHKSIISTILLFLNFFCLITLNEFLFKFIYLIV